MPLAQDETPNTRVPAIRYHGMVYRISESGQTYDGEIYESEILLTTEEPAPLSEWPEKEGQANFGALSMPYAMTAYGLVVEIDGAWKLFEPLLPDVDKGLFEAAYAQVLLEKYTLDRETARLNHLGEDPTEEMDTSDYFIHQRLVRLWWICDSYDSAVSVEQTSGSVRLSEVAYAENVNALYFAFAAPHNIAFDTEPVICVNGMPYGVIDDSGFFNLTETQTEHYAFYSIQPGVLSGEKITITFGDARFCFRYDAVKKTVTLAQDETPNAVVPAIMHKGELYVLYGEPVNVSAPGEGEAIEYVVSIVPSSEWPTEDGQANFGEVGTPYAVTKGGFIAQINGEWRLFEAEEPGHEPTEEPTGTWQCVLFEDTLYVLTDQDCPFEPDESAIVGAIETVVPGPTVTKNFEANFGEPGMKLALTRDGLFILYNNEWRRLAPDTASGDGEPVSNALCLFFDGCLNYAPFENWVWSNHDDGLAADGMSFVYKMEEIVDKIPTIHNPAELMITAADGVHLEPNVTIYNAELNTVAFGSVLSEVRTLDPGTYYVSQRVSRREEGRNAGYECVVRLEIEAETVREPEQDPTAFPGTFRFWDYDEENGYREAPKEGVLFVCDFDGNGKEEEIRYEVRGSTLTISVGKKSVALSYGAELEQVILLNLDPASARLNLLVVYNTGSEDYETAELHMENGKFVRGPVIYAYCTYDGKTLRGSASQTDILGTKWGDRTYHGENLTPDSEWYVCDVIPDEIPSASDREHLIDNGKLLHLVRDLPCTIEGADAVIPAGSYIYMTRWHESGTLAEIRTEDGTVTALVTVQSADPNDPEQYGYLIDGETQDTYFDNIFYAD